MNKKIHLSGGEKFMFNSSIIIKMKSMEKKIELGTNINPSFNELEKQNAIENIAWQIFLNHLRVSFKRELTPEEKKQITDKPEFEYYREKAVKIYEKKQKALLNKKYPIIDVPASGKSNWSGGAFTLCFVYSKYDGNFVLRGYLKEVKDYLIKHHTHYFCNYSLWSNGFNRDIWEFWKDNVYIFRPDRHHSKYHKPEYKFKIGQCVDSYLSDDENKLRKEQRILLKRLPKRWIPEFDKF